MGTSAFRVLAFAAAIVLFFTLPSILIKLSDYFAEFHPIDFDDAGSEKVSLFGGRWGTAIVWLSLITQAALLTALVQHERGEQLGFATLYGITLVAAFVLTVLPGTLISLVRMMVAISELKINQDAKRQFVLYFLVTLLPGFFICSCSNKPSYLLRSKSPKAA